METLRNLFHRKTPQELIRENKRAIQRARRELNRETNRLQNEKRRAENEIRALAAKGEKAALRVAAKNIVRQRNQLNKFATLDATLSTLESEATTMNAQITMSNVMLRTTRTLAMMNRMFNVENFQQTMQNFEQNMLANNIKQELIDDAMGSAFDDEEDESEELVDQVLAELNIDMKSIPNAASGNEDAQRDGTATIDRDLSARLERIRKS